MGATFPRVTTNLDVTLPDAKLGPDRYDHVWDDISEIDGKAMHYDRAGNPITLRQWATGVEDSNYRWVKVTDVSAEWRVVTVWNGIDMNGLLDSDQARIFGTIAIKDFETDHTTYHDEETDVSEADALDTHNRRVSELKKELGIA